MVFVTFSCADHPTQGTCLWLPWSQAGLCLQGGVGALGVCMGWGQERQGWVGGGGVMPKSGCGV